MDLADCIEFCIGLPEVEETTPFGPEVLVYKVAGKMFALTNPDEHPPRMNLKCDPKRAEELRADFDCVKPGYHMNKKHWNTVHFTGELSAKLTKELLLHSYKLVVMGLKKKDRERITKVLEQD